VTQEEYEAVIGKNPSWFKPGGGGKEEVAGLDTRHFPVDTVSWQEAKEFCRKLSAKEGKAYRLPSEAEWEYMCRAGTLTPFHTGETIAPDQANYHGKHVYGNGKKGEFRARPTKVGSFAPNEWGLHDMHGNVWQLWEDWYERKYYATAPKNNHLNAEAGTARLIRGGSWNDKPEACRSANRSNIGIFGRNISIGFRVVSPSP
jgi:formylglycine-generating enzyme required for sulfatase activity